MQELTKARRMVEQFEDALSSSGPEDDRASILSSRNYWRAEVEWLERVIAQAE